ncbi:MAG TPA: deoxyuridine 5'-triphosphate nucleotidohydrolase [Thermomicrobiales bacterium]
MVENRAILPGVLSREQLRERIAGDPPLISEWLDLEAQLQPNGFDLTLAEVHSYEGPGTLPRDNAGRILPPLTPIEPDADGMYHLSPGPYHVVYNEVVHLPEDLMALGRPRSSLNRSGVTIHTAVWDAGYHGRSTSLLVVINPHGFRIERGARLLQLVFFGLSRPVAEGYRGIYQRENLTRRG